MSDNWRSRGAAARLGSPAFGRHIPAMSKSQTPETKQPEPAPAKTPPERAKDKEIGGPKGPDPTRYGDWTVNGRCIDF